MLGVENLKKLLKAALSFPKQIAESSADGWQFTDIFSFMDEIVGSIGVVKSWASILAELKDLDASEKEELYQYVVDEFDIPDDKVEIFVEHALLQAISLITLVEEFKLLKKKQDEVPQ